MPPRRRAALSSTRQGSDNNDFTRDLRSGTAKAATTRSDSMDSTSQPSETQQRKPSAVWDWELPTHSAAAGDINNYYEYEPPEILQQQASTQTQAPSSTGFNMPLPPNQTDQAGSVVMPHHTPSKSQQIGTGAGTKRKSISDSVAHENIGPKRTSIATDTRPFPSPSEACPSVCNPPLTRSEPSSISVPMAGAIPGAIPDHNLDESLISPRTTKRGFSDPSVVCPLPARKVFGIKVGNRLFQLSGQSISSDRPSYFTSFFEEQLRKQDRTDGIGPLYIDRDPDTFNDIALHLQGYHVEPRDGPHFVRLFADAQYYSLPRLTSQLFSSAIYIRIGDTDFHIPRDIFNKPGDSPNFFSLDISIFFTAPTDRAAGSAQKALLRPPAILPPSVPNRSAKIFADLLHILKGYDVEIRNEQHRAELLRDARYFHLKGLEQRLIHHNITYNLARQRSEIRIRLEDIRQSGISFVPDLQGVTPSAAPSPSTSSSGSSNGSNSPGWVFYQRPYVDTESHALIIEISTAECATMSIAPASPSAQARVGRVTFYSSTLARISSLLSVVATRLGLPNIQPLGTAAVAAGNKAVSLPSSPVIHNAFATTANPDERVKARIGPDADVRINGQRWTIGVDASTEDADSAMDATGTLPMNSARKSFDADDAGLEVVLRRSQWRIRIQPVSAGGQASRSGAMEAVLGAVKLDAFTNERARNAELGFLQ